LGKGIIPTGLGLQFSEEEPGEGILAVRRQLARLAKGVGSGNSGTSFPESMAPGASLGSGRYFSFSWW